MKLEHLLIAILAPALLAGCEGCEAEVGQDERVVSAEGRQGRPSARTEDGYEIVHATEPGRPARARPLGNYDPDTLVREPTSPDPLEGQWDLTRSVVGLGDGGDGTLIMEMRTDLGTVFCDLHADEVPASVAHFIGLARGIRRWWDARAGEWVARPMYHATHFHRVVPGFAVQGGDYLGDGTGRIGFTIPQESHDSLRHDRAGQLCLVADDGEGNGGQFFITDGPAPHLDEDPQAKHTIIGQCRPVEVINQIARVPQRGEDNAPVTPVRIDRVLIRRVRGGAAVATTTPPQTTPEFDPVNRERGASPGPSELAIPGRVPEIQLPPELQQARERALRERAARQGGQDDPHAGHTH